ncbi:MAG: hypothetical protein EPN20_06165 [Magnetospirillum sp.]|nr:MAG: hypothetical protein EPN20_06165 [Magnetospirillum sp.]
MISANGAKVMGTLRTLLNWAVDSRLVSKNDLAGRKSKRGSREKKRVPIPAGADVAKLLVEADKLLPPHGLYVRTAVLTGCRAGELRGLQWRHVDFTATTIMVEQRAEQDGTIGQPKTASGHRTVPLPAGLLSKLKEAHLAAGRKSDAFVFANRAGEPLDHDAFSGRHWRPLAHQPDGPEGYSLYDTLEFYWRDQGCPLDEASARADAQVESFLRAVLAKT